MHLSGDPRLPTALPNLPCARLGTLAMVSPFFALGGALCIESPTSRLARILAESKVKELCCYPACICTSACFKAAFSMLLVTLALRGKCSQFLGSYTRFSLVFSLRYKLNGRNLIQCWLKGDDVEWSKLPTCECKTDSSTSLPSRVFVFVLCGRSVTHTAAEKYPFCC